MKNILFFIIVLSLGITLSAQNYDKQVFPTSRGDLTIVPIGHASIMFVWNDLTIHIDPVLREADYLRFPDADVILLTHHHGDHTDKEAVNMLYTDTTRVILTEQSLEKLTELDLDHAQVMHYWDTTSFKGLGVEAIPAYNIEHKRPNGEPYHPRGVGNGYVLTFENYKVLIGGDTEDIPEYEKLRDYNIDAAFLPMNIPYTMTPRMVAHAASMIRPRILYPYHYGDTNTDELFELMVDDPWLEIRILSF